MRCGVLTHPPNNGMHPTPHQQIFHARCVGARVMPGVSLLLNSQEERKCQ
jgi:hypothetical protein